MLSKLDVERGSGRVPPTTLASTSNWARANGHDDDQGQPILLAALAELAGVLQFRAWASDGPACGFGMESPNAVVAGTGRRRRSRGSLSSALSRYSGSPTGSRSNRSTLCSRSPMRRVIETVAPIVKAVASTSRSSTVSSEYDSNSYHYIPMDVAPRSTRTSASPQWSRAAGDVFGADLPHVFRARIDETVAGVVERFVGKARPSRSVTAASSTLRWVRRWVSSSRSGSSPATRRSHACWRRARAPDRRRASTSSLTSRRRGLRG